MKSLNAYLQEYGSFHETRGNRVCHGVGVPLIMVSLLGLLANVGIPLSVPFAWDLGLVFLLIAMVWYLLLDWKLALSFGPVALGAYAAGRPIPPSLLWSLFVAGWVFQLIGHALYEKKSPAFFRNFEHLLIGPLWVFLRIVDRKRVEH